MTDEKDDSNPAYPSKNQKVSKDPGSAWTTVSFSGVPNSQVPPSISLRDYFAAAALQGLISSETMPLISEPKAIQSTWAYEYADAMLKARKKGD